MNADKSIFAAFTDGASRGNPGPGGWGAVVIEAVGLPSAGTATVRELGGAAVHTTNNAMELTAAVEALKKVPKGSRVSVHTDSSYVTQGVTSWVKGWKRNGWKTKTKQDVINRDLWEELDALASERNVSWVHVGGHVGILGNERCDHIATAFADGRKLKLYKGALAKYDIPSVLDISLDQEKAAGKKSASYRSRAKAYSYVSSVNGKIEVHQTWAECEKRVKGAPGARYRKSLDADDELRIVGDFGDL